MASDSAVTDLLAVLAYGELCAFDRLADDARMAPDLAARAAMSGLAATEFGYYQRLAVRIAELGVDPALAMTPYVAALETFHSLTEPQTWPEAVVKAYVGNRIAGDFYSVVAGRVDETSAALIHDVLADDGRADFAVDEVKAAVAEHPAVTGRLALWARRLLGEALSQTQHVLADRPSLTRLVVEADPEMVQRLAQRHTERMVRLGLES